uniref:SnoaL-like domain-containing protein n=1 Tax=Caenorhabditis tropicalis TaxID=1561998 RepID=A0A1I7USC4_9PELO
MRLLVFSLLVLAAVSATDPVEVTNRHLTAAFNAFKSGNQEELFKMLFTSDGEQLSYLVAKKVLYRRQKHFPEFSKRIHNVNIIFDSAKNLPDGNIEAIVKVNNVHQAKIVLKQNPQSPTGWSIIGVGRLDTTSRHIASWWSMCYVGYFWCAIELLAVWGVGH